MRILILAAAALLSATHAFAATFNVSGTTTTDGFTVSGTMEIDTALGSITDMNVLFANGVSYSFGTVLFQSTNEFGTGEYGANVRAFGADVDVNFIFEGTADLVGYAGGAIVGNLFDLQNSAGFGFFFADKLSVDPVSAVPLPATAALLGGGVLLLGALRRRKRT